MPTPTAVSRRVQQTITHLQSRDWEGALVNLFPAADKTAKRRRPKEGVGARMRSFFEDEEGLISCIATKNYMRGIFVDGISITDALYKFGRTSIAHEGELDPRLKFNEEGRLAIGQGQWDLPVSYIFALSVAVITAPENEGERLPVELSVRFLDEQFPVNELWGQRATVRQFIAQKFGNPRLFEHE